MHNDNAIVPWNHVILLSHGIIIMLILLSQGIIIGIGNDRRKLGILGFLISRFYSILEFHR